MLRKARIAKDKLRRDYEFQTQTAVQLAKIWMDSELAAIEYRKNPTKENMDRLYRAIHGMMNLHDGFDGRGAAVMDDRQATPELAQLVEEYKEHTRLALHHQQEAYFRMTAVMEFLTTGNMADVERIMDVTKTLKIL